MTTGFEYLLIQTEYIRTHTNKMVTLDLGSHFNEGKKTGRIVTLKRVECNQRNHNGLYLTDHSLSSISFACQRPPLTFPVFCLCVSLDVFFVSLLWEVPSKSSQNISHCGKAHSESWNVDTRLEEL